MLKIFGSLVILAFLSNLTFASDFPHCSYRGYHWLAQDDVVNVNIDTNGVCHHGFNAGRKSVFHDLQVLKKPSHGNIEVVSVSEIRYTADSNYNGKDAYSIKVCSTIGGLPPVGCSTINYKLNIDHDN